MLKYFLRCFGAVATVSSCLEASKLNGGHEHKYISGLSGVSNRIFINSTQYLCSENFNIFIQKIPDISLTSLEPSTSRQNKMGSIGTLYGEGLFREVKPQHVHWQSKNTNPDYRLIFDEELAQSLWHLYKGSGNRKCFWNQKIFPSLFSFYYANTDGLSNQSNLVYSQSSIERLLLGDKFGKKKLILSLREFLIETGYIGCNALSTGRDWKSISRSDGLSENIIEAWISELTDIRNLFAHGNHSSSHGRVWSHFEHELLASFFFPMLIKLSLGKVDLDSGYKVENLDLARYEIFDQLLSTKDYFKLNDRGMGSSWSELLSKASRASEPVNIFV